MYQHFASKDAILEAVVIDGFTVRFSDGSSLPEVVVEYPIGHRRRRAEAIPLLEEKFARNLRRIFSPAQCASIEEVSQSAPELDAMRVCDYVNLYVPSSK